MKNMKNWTIIERDGPGTVRQVLRSGMCEEQYLPVPREGESILVGIAARPRHQEIDLAGETPVILDKVIERPEPEPTEAEIIIEAMKAKLTPAELSKAQKDIIKNRTI
jgi:hypothetical protein